MPISSGALCPRHAGVLAVDLCERCGAFVCGDCLVLLKGRTLCTSCSQVPFGPSQRAIAAFVLAVLGWLLCPPFTLVAIPIAWAERAAIERKEAPSEGQAWVRLALGFAGVQIALVGLLVVAFIAWRLLRSP
jgi:hypothetical protein